MLCSVGLALVVAGVASAAPRAATVTQVPAGVDLPAPIVTPAAYIGLYKENPKRNIFDDIGNAVNSVLDGLPSFVASGVPNFFQDFPVGSDVASKLDIATGQLDALPTQVLNVPPYANWTDQGWNLRFRGNVYKQPEISQDKIDSLANIFLIDVDIKDLPPDQQRNARNLTQSIFIVQQDSVNVTFHLEPAPAAGADGEPGGGGAVTPSGGTQNVVFPNPTTDQGDFDDFVSIQSNGLTPGNATRDIQRLNVYTDGTLTGNATAYLVPPEGFTVIADIDDILRVTKIYKPKEGLLNSFARNFTAWLNMPEIFADWSKNIPGMHFHYLTTTPEQATRTYMNFIYNTYPGGSFDTRPLNFSDVDATLAIRKYLLVKIFQTYPTRKFILLADTSNSDVMKAYPEMAVEFPNQVQCILLRNTSATDSDNKFPYDTSGFKDLKTSQYMFFKVPDDLRGLNIVGGQCLNATIPQNVTFGLQAEELGIHGAGEMVRVPMMFGLVAALAVAFFGLL